MKFEYTDKQATKNKFLEIVNHPILNKFNQGLQSKGLQEVFAEIDAMGPGDSESWTVIIQMATGFSDSCEIRLTLPGDLNISSVEEQEVKQEG